MIIVDIQQQGIRQRAATLDEAFIRSWVDTDGSQADDDHGIGVNIAVGAVVALSRAQARDRLGDERLYGGIIRCVVFCERRQCRAGGVRVSKGFACPFGEEQSVFAQICAVRQQRDHIGSLRIGQLDLTRLLRQQHPWRGVVAGAEVHRRELGGIAVFCAVQRGQPGAVDAERGEDDLRLGAVGHERRIARQLVDGQIQIIFPCSIAGFHRGAVQLGIGCHIEHDPVAGAVGVSCCDLVHQGFAGTDTVNSGGVNVHRDRLAQGLVTLAPSDGSGRLDDLAGVVLLRKLQLAVHHFEIILVGVALAHGAGDGDAFICGFAALEQCDLVILLGSSGHRQHIVVLSGFLQQLVLGFAAASVGVAAAVDEIAAADGALAVEIIGLALCADQDAGVGAVLNGGLEIAGLIARLAQQAADRAAGSIDGAGIIALADLHAVFVGTHQTADLGVRIGAGDDDGTVVGAAVHGHADIFINIFHAVIIAAHQTADTGAAPCQRRNGGVVDAVLDLDLAPGTPRDAAHMSIGLGAVDRAVHGQILHHHGGLVINGRGAVSVNFTVQTAEEAEIAQAGVVHRDRHAVAVAVKVAAKGQRRPGTGNGNVLFQFDVSVGKLAVVDLFCKITQFCCRTDEDGRLLLAIALRLGGLVGQGDRNGLLGIVFAHGKGGLRHIVIGGVFAEGDGIAVIARRREGVDTICSC